MTMRSLLVTAAVVIAGAAGSPAHAASFDYRASCDWGTVDGLGDTTGEVSLYAVPTDATGVPTGADVTAWCELVVNGVSYGTVLGPVSGTGAVAAAGPLQYTVDPADYVVVCVHVTVGAETAVTCPVSTGDPMPPQEISDAVRDVLDAVYAVVQPTLCAVDDDPTVLGQPLWDC